MADRTVLHVGTMKSATTYIQDLCDANAEVLAEAGVLWPGSRLNFAAVANLLGSQHQRPQDGNWDQLAEMLRAHTSVALISDELLSFRRLKALRRLIRAIESPGEAVITARDLGRVIPSQWRTGHENHRPTPWPEFVDALTRDEVDHPGVSWFWRRHDLPAIVATWQKLLGPDAVTIVTVPPAGAPPEVVAQRFMSVIGVDPATFKPSTRKAAPRKASTPLLLTPDQVEWARRRAHEMVDALAALDVHVVGSLEDLLPTA